MRTAALWLAVAAWRAGGGGGSFALAGTCTSSCTGTTTEGDAFDLAPLMNTPLQTIGSDTSPDEYYLQVCGALGPSTVQCPGTDVTTGSAIQLMSDGSGCYVLGTYEDSNCQWSSNIPDPSLTGILLTMSGGSSESCPIGGGSREVRIAFTCPEAGTNAPVVPTTWSASVEPTTCVYDYVVPTCAACEGGCASLPPGPGPPPSPGGGGGGAATWSTGFLIATLAVCLPLYLVGGALYNYYAKGARGLEILRITPWFWSALYENVKAGIVFTFTCGKSAGGRSGGGGSGGDYDNVADATAAGANKSTSYGATGDGMI